MNDPAMVTTAVGLAILAVLLVWPVPRALARARWTHADPVAALILWQAIGLAGGLSMAGAGLVYAVAGLGSNLWSGLAQLGRQALAAEPLAGMGVSQVVALGLAVATMMTLGVGLLISLVRTLAQRARHRDVLALISDPSAELADTRVLDHPEPVAYCLPGTRPVLVVSRGMIQQFGAEELRAVIAHERAHLAQRHDLVMLPFVAWYVALPWLPGTDAARRAVTSLIEMLADDRASETCDRNALATAIARAAAGPRLDAALGVAPVGTVSTRVARLVEPYGALPGWVRPSAIASAFALVGIPTVILAMLSA